MSAPLVDVDVQDELASPLLSAGILYRVDQSDVHGNFGVIFMTAVKTNWSVSIVTRLKACLFQQR